MKIKLQIGRKYLMRFEQGRAESFAAPIIIIGKHKRGGYLAYRARGLFANGSTEPTALAIANGDNGPMEDKLAIGKVFRLTSARRIVDVNR